MIFGKDSEAFRLELERLGNSVGRRLEDIAKSQAETTKVVEELKARVDEELSRRSGLDESTNQALSDSLDKLNEKLSSFEKSIASFDNLKNRIDDMLFQRVKEITEAELKLVRDKINEFTSLQEEFKSLSLELARMRSELAKWNSISAQVKEVDFTLQKHAKELEIADKAKLELERENENLKGILSKMKRSRTEGYRNSQRPY